MRTWDEVIKKAYDIYLNRDKYAYWYGAKGQVLTDAEMTRLISEEEEFFSRYSAAQIRAFMDYSRGKIGLDCSGFVAACTGVNTWSKGLIEACDNRNDDVYEGVAGALLYLPGHVGIDVGFGMALDFPGQGRTCELTAHRHGLRKWTECGELRGIDYTGADAR